VSKGEGKLKKLTSRTTLPVNDEGEGPEGEELSTEMKTMEFDKAECIDMFDISEWFSGDISSL
jgi:hypothetical protein